MLRHIVLIKVAEGVTPAEVDGVFEILAALKTKIPGIISFDAGINCSTESLNKGYTHVFMMDFTDVAARDAYLPHPEHQAIQSPLMEILADDEDKVLVMDFEF